MATAALTSTTITPRASRHSCSAYKTPDRAIPTPAATTTARQQRALASLSKDKSNLVSHSQTKSKSKKRQRSGAAGAGVHGLGLGLDQDSDLLRNGRALFNATTTALGAPVEIDRSLVPAAMMTATLSRSGSKRRRVGSISGVRDGGGEDQNMTLPIPVTAGNGADALPDVEADADIDADADADADTQMLEEPETPQRAAGGTPARRPSVIKPTREARPAQPLQKPQQHADGSSRKRARGAGDGAKESASVSTASSRRSATFPPQADAWISQPQPQAHVQPQTQTRSAASHSATKKRSSVTKRERTSHHPLAATGNAAAGVCARRERDAADERERERERERRTLQEHEAAEWKAKYKKAFTKFVFYFDAVEEGRRRETERAFRELGARVESFFSKTVTHVVTSRPIPTPPTSLPLTTTTTANATNPNNNPFRSIFAQPAPSLTGRTGAGPGGRNRHSSSVSPVKYALGSGKGQQQRLAQKNANALAGGNGNGNGNNGTAGSNTFAALKTPPKIKSITEFKAESRDILVKAQEFEMKIWTLEKLAKMLDRLLDHPWSGMHGQAGGAGSALHAAGSVFAHQMAAAGVGGVGGIGVGRASLPSLLRAEALTGSTYERDMAVLRPDYCYFSSKHGYLLVEDSSGEYQPAHAKEYASKIPLVNPAVAGKEALDEELEAMDAPDYPVLYGGMEGRGAFFKIHRGWMHSLPNMTLMRKNRLAAEQLAAPAATVTAAKTSSTTAAADAKPNLRRTVSLNGLGKVGALSKASSANHNHNLAGVAKSHQHLHHLDSFQAASGNSQILTSNIASATSTTTTRSGQVIGRIGAGAGGSANSLANGVIVDKRLARLGSKARKHIVTLGGGAQAQAAGNKAGELGKDKENQPPLGGLSPGKAGAMKRSVSYESGLVGLGGLYRNGRKVRAEPGKPPKEQPKKPGYCENCRVRYDDFKTHTKSRKHRKFALDTQNWCELDELIADKIRRPVLPELLELYAAAETEVPSDVEASDDSDDDSEEFDNEAQQIPSWEEYQRKAYADFLALDITIEEFKRQGEEAYQEYMADKAAGMYDNLSVCATSDEDEDDEDVDSGEEEDALESDEDDEDQEEDE